MRRLQHRDGRLKEPVKRSVNDNLRGPAESGGNERVKRSVRRLDQPNGNPLPIVVRSLPGDTPEDLERMIAKATNGEATAEILHIKPVAV